MKISHTFEGCVRSPPPFSAGRIDVFVSNAGEEEVTMVTNNFCVTHRMRMPYAQLGSVGNPSAESAESGWGVRFEYAKNKLHLFWYVGILHVWFIWVILVYD